MFICLGGGAADLSISDISYVFFVVRGWGGALLTFQLLVFSIFPVFGGGETKFDRCPQVSRFKSKQTRLALK